MQLDVTGEIFSWRGPAPYQFVRVPDDAVRSLREVASLVTYGWGMIPVTAVTGATTWTTSLFPKDGGYLIPIKVAVQRAEQVDVGDTLTIRLHIEPADR